MYIVHTSFVSLETTFYLRVILQGFVDPIMQQVPLIKNKKERLKAEPAWLRRLERTLYRTLDQSLSPTNACIFMYKYVDPKRLSCHAGHQEVSRFCTRAEFEGSMLALKPKAGITRSVSGPSKRTDVLRKIFKNKEKKNRTIRSYIRLHHPYIAHLVAR